MSQPWGLILSVPDGAQLFLVDGAVKQSDHVSPEAAIDASGLVAERLIVLDRVPAAAPPVRVLPDMVADLGGLLQDRPMAWLSPAQRIVLAGVIYGRANWDGVVCLIEDAASHWVHISAGEIISFQGASTGRLITALGGDDAACDADAMGDTLSRPERMAAQVHSAGLAGDAAAVTGHLIGAELAAMRPYWLGQEVLLVTDAQLYADALGAQGVMVTSVVADTAWQDGLRALGQKAGLCA